TDSIVVVDSQRPGPEGRFVFSGDIYEPGLYRMHFAQDRFILLSLDKGNMKVTAAWPIEDYKTEGSPASAELKAFIDGAKMELIATNNSQRRRDSIKSTGNESALAEAEKAFQDEKNIFTVYVKNYGDTTRYEPNAILAANIFNVKEEMPYLEGFAK